MDEREIYNELKTMEDDFENSTLEELEHRIYTVVETDEGYLSDSMVITGVNAECLEVTCDFKKIKEVYALGEDDPTGEIFFDYNKIIREWECSDHITKGFLSRRERGKWILMQTLTSYDEEINKVEGWKKEAIEKYENAYGVFK